MKNKNVVVLGGGTGQSLIAGALRKLPVKVTCVVPISDDGGSTGRLTRQYGTSACAGDWFRCALALSPHGELLAPLKHRFSGGDLEGHVARNLIFAVFEKEFGLPGAVTKLSQLLNLTPHKVLPVSLRNAILCAEVGTNGKTYTIRGEHEIGEKLSQSPLWDPELHPIKHVWLEPHIKAWAPVLEAVALADYIVLPPGDLITSVMAVLAARGLRKVIANSKAKLVIFVNILTKRGETDNYSAMDFVHRLEGATGKEADYIIVNNKKIPPELLSPYARESKRIVLPPKQKDSRVIPAPLWRKGTATSIVHDQRRVVAVLRQIFQA